MSRREAWLSAAAVFAVALVIRIVAAAMVRFPVPEDTAYYAGVARNLAEGRGLISNALWSYQTQPLEVPRAAFELWLPLPSLLEAIPAALLGAAEWFRAAQVVSVLAGSVVAVLAWRLGADVAAEMRLPAGRARTMGVGTGLVAAALSPLVMYAALPDSTALFAALSLAACLLMTRIASGAASGTAGAASGSAGAASSSARFDRRLIALGLLLGLAALTRSEAIWLGLAWAAVAWLWTPGSRRRRAGSIAVPAVVAILVVAPWVVRDWLAFGTPLPGQTIGNALYLQSTDIFAYSDPPTLARFLSAGPAALADIYAAGFANDLFGVLLVTAFPVGLVGLVALPWVGRRSALRPLVLASVCTFLVTSLAFPVATLSGTFLHAAGSAFVLLSVCAVVGLDELIVRIGRIRHWTRPVAWFGPAFAIAAIGPLCAISIGTISRQAEDVAARYEALPAAMARAGVPLDNAAPVITDAPIWLAEATGVRTLALPEESPSSVVALANRFGARLLVVREGTNREWPQILGDQQRDTKCFQEVPLTDISGRKPANGSPLATIRVYRIVCT